MSGVPDEVRDPDGFAKWRHDYQMPAMAQQFPRAAAVLPPCPVCDQDAAGHVSGAAVAS